MELEFEDIPGLKYFDPIDVYRARLIYRISSERDHFYYQAIMLLSNYIQRGHSCLYLEEIAGTRLCDHFADFTDDNVEEKIEKKFPDLQDLVSSFERYLSETGEGVNFPVILEGTTLYFLKQKIQEETVYNKISIRRSFRCNLLPEMKNIFTKLFPGSFEHIDNQALAAFITLRNRITVISGGPGTGKTSTVVKILYLLTHDASLRGKNLNVSLSAPTGKAAARLKESIDRSIESSEIFSEIGDSMSTEASTIHRLLGSRSGSRGFYHNSRNLLPCDVLIVDESSMVDLSLMSKLMDALRDDARIVLLGDRDQLSSVEGGAVFGDICGRGNEQVFSRELVHELSGFFGKHIESLRTRSKPVVMEDNLVVLNRSYRFDDKSAIKEISNEINRGNGDRVLELLKGDNDTVKYIGPGEMEEYVISRIESFIDGSDEINTEEVTSNFLSRFMVLTALKKGSFGIQGMNNLCEKIMVRRKLITPDSRFYKGRPIMVTGNNYSIGLFNGDRGIVKDISGNRRVVFGENKSIPLSRIPEHITSYSMTIHKSQGSEFDEVLIVLPQSHNRILTRELLYTAITRARTRVVISGTDNVVKNMVETQTSRQTGLGKVLW